jgi:N-acyl amino acid synthase of PEP-CTERM/exosortase system
MINYRFSLVKKNPADCDAELEEIFRLRFKVYCEEWGFEDPANYPDGMEQNEYDKYAAHFAIRCTSDESIIGSARVIFPSELGYPITKFCTIDPIMYELASGGLKNMKIGEVSRLAISKDFRKRIEDDYQIGYSSELPDAQHVDPEKRRYNFVHEFYKYLLLQSISMGLNHWYIVMKRGLYVLLKRIGMVYHPIGPEIEYHGLRTPYLGNLQEIRERMLKKDPHCFEFVEELLKQATDSNVKFLQPPVPPSASENRQSAVHSCLPEK